jgi:hypothetical protein
MSEAKLPKTQAKLLEAMRKGVICHYMPYAGNFNPTAYYFRNDTMRRCTAQVKGLLERGLVEKFAEEWRGHKVRAKK